MKKPRCSSGLFLYLIESFDLDVTVGFFEPLNQMGEVVEVVDQNLHFATETALAVAFDVNALHIHLQVFGNDIGHA